MGVDLLLCIVVTLSQNAVVFPGVKLSIRSFILFCKGHPEFFALPYTIGSVGQKIWTSSSW